MNVICKLGFSRRGPLTVAAYAVMLRGAVVPRLEEMN
jgi:hypothetical protein